MKLKLITIALLLTTTLLCAQSNENYYQQIEAQTANIYDDLVSIRRDLHMYPEASKQEKRTANIVATYLKNLGLEVKTGIGGYGVVGILKGGKEGRKIAWRADMDAIVTDDPDVVEFASKNKGVRHICGHDVHTTIALGIATILSKQKKNLEGTVYFIFQPAEEMATGAKDMIADGLFDIISPDEIYGLHIGMGAAGTINYKPNELFAYQRSLSIAFKPNANEKELEQFMHGLLQSFNRNIKVEGSPWNLISKLSDPVVGLENKETIFKDYFLLVGAEFIKGENTNTYNANILETNSEKLKRLPSEIKKQILNSKFKDAFVSIEHSKHELTPINDQKLTDSSEKILRNTYNTEMVKPLYGQIPFFGEDFIYYQQKVPGVFFLLGGSNFEKGIISMPHTPNFAVDEKTIQYGVQSFATLLLTRTNSH